MEVTFICIVGYVVVLLYALKFWEWKTKHTHEWKVCETSNVLQIDHEEHPYRLCLCECATCGEREQLWREVKFDELQELETGKSVLLEWR